jgi:hypothetical protein
MVKFLESKLEDKRFCTKDKKLQTLRLCAAVLCKQLVGTTIPSCLWFGDNGSLSGWLTRGRVLCNGAELFGCFVERKSAILTPIHLFLYFLISLETVSFSGDILCQAVKKKLV